MTRFRIFFLGLAATFFIPWLCLIAVPHAKMKVMAPYALDPEDPTKGVYPPAVPNIARQGHKVYSREGCAQCHTQVIRPTYLGVDSWKKGWGQDQESKGPVFTRATQPLDYLGDTYAHIGIARNGPDLSNVGYRRTDIKWLHEHMYDPKQFNEWSIMPGFRHLYHERRIDGQPSADALEIKGKHAPKEGFEIVPSDDAKALAGYLLTLKKDAPVELEKEPTAAPAPAPATASTN